MVLLWPIGKGESKAVHPYLHAIRYDMMCILARRIVPNLSTRDLGTLLWVQPTG